MPENYCKTVLAITHSSTRLLFEDEFVDLELVKRDNFLLSDLYTDEIYFLKYSLRVVAPYSRFSLDVERYWDDEKEVMAKVGMGKIYTRSISGKPNRCLDKVKLIQYRKIYDEYHNNLRKAVESIGLNALLIDCHSFNPVPFSFDLDQSLNRPDLCIGFNNDSTKPSEEMIRKLVDAAKAFGLNVALNRPFSGSMTTPVNFPYTSIMLEINKKLYLREDMATKKVDFCKTVDVMQKLLKSIGK
jgi:N-formylglutamate amidohydrolase